MIDAKALLADLKRLVKHLEDDLRRRCDEHPESAEVIAREFARAKERGRTGATKGAFRDEFVTQVAVAWVLGTVFVRFLEDNDFLDHAVLAGPGERLRRAKDHQTLFFDQHPSLSEREFLLSVFRDVASLPGLSGLFDERHNPLFLLGPTADGATAILEALRRIDPETGDLVHDFTDAAKETRFLGDLYQDLSESVRKKYALLQTPEFVEEFILDRTLDPAIEEFGLEEVTLIDPTCGSGHFLLGAFRRLLERRQQAAPGENVRHLAQQVLDQVYGVDVNPYAVEIARFRLLIAALVASGVERLKGAPDFRTNLAVGDSLLFGRRPRHIGGAQRNFTDDSVEHYFVTEDREAVVKILERQYDVVVGNPPYITPKDPVARDLYRDRYDSCYGKYALVVPFIERMFDLAAYADEREKRSGFVGMIVANSFMKREFGRKVIEEFLRKKDLTHVVDLSGAYIPGHGTPTVVLCARGRMPVSETVRGVLGIRGEPGPPDDPAEGLVWKEVTGNLDEPGFEGMFVSVAELPRARLATHPWSLGGGGATELKEHLSERASTTLGEIAVAIGICAVTGEDDLYMLPDSGAVRRHRLDAVRPLVEGDAIRDWVIGPASPTVWTYDEDLEVRPLAQMRSNAKYLWHGRAAISRRRRFGTPMIERGLTWYEWQELYAEKLRTPLSIAFAEVATHNHFVLDRGGKVFNRTAPVIKLPPDATEDDHLGLLGLLNSSTACFWGRQTVFSKGGFADGKWQERLQWNGTKLLRFPVPEGRPLSRAARIDALAQQLQVNLPEAVAKAATPSGGATDDAHRQADSLLVQAIAEQEELDWECYRLYGLLDDDLCAPADSVPPLHLGQRAFEIVLARRVAAGETQTKWFERHGSTPITDLPSDWPEPYRRVVERRIELIESDPNIRLIEQPEYKRRWNVEPWDDLQERALRGWLLDRLEQALQSGEPRLLSCARLADLVQSDDDFHQVAELYEGRPDFDVGKLIQRLVLDEAVPYLPVLRYKPSGLRKRKDWEATWDLQRKEDAIDALDLPPDEAKARKRQEVGEIPVPPKYKSSDFLKSTYWRLRGKLDVPKERFILYPHAERDVDGTPVLAWAGLDHLQQARALAAYTLERKENDGWEKERLQPLLAGLLELVPWLKQWHDDVDPEYGVGMGTYFEGFVDEEARGLGMTLDEVRAWAPPEGARGRRGTR